MDAELDRAIAAGEVNVPAGAKGAQGVMQLAQRPGDATTSFVTGADVSRFARRSVPTTGAPAIGNGPVATAPAGAPPRNTGPVVRVVRGNAVSDSTAGGK